MRAAIVIAIVSALLAAGGSAYFFLDLTGDRIERLAGEGEAARQERDEAIDVSEVTSKNAQQAVDHAAHISHTISAGAQADAMRAAQERSIEASIREPVTGNDAPIPAPILTTIDELYATRPLVSPGEP